MPRKGVAKNRAPKDDKRFNAAAFYNALSSVFEARKIPWTHVSRETGVTTSTLSQMKVGRRPDAASLAALSAWAGLNPAHFVRRLQRGTPDLVGSISDILRIDQTLQPKAASALETIIRLAADPDIHYGHLDRQRRFESIQYGRRCWSGTALGFQHFRLNGWPEAQLLIKTKSESRSNRRCEAPVFLSAR